MRADGSDQPWALAIVAGIPVVSRAILTLGRAGVARVHIMAGRQVEDVRGVVEGTSAIARAGLDLRFVADGDGLAVDGACLLVEGDHVFDVALVRRIASLDLDREDAALLVEAGGSRDSIGCGVLAVAPGFQKLLADEIACADPTEGGLASALRDATARGRVRTVDAADGLWQRVDSAESRRRAAKKLLASLRKRGDGPVSRYLNRPLSLALTSVLLNLQVTPNQMTVVANLFGVLGVWFVWQKTWTGVAVGAVLVNVQSVLDGCDGEIARLKFASSRFGEWLDNVLDDHVNVGYGLALGIATAALLDQPIYRWLGIAAAVGFSMYNVTVYAQLALVHRSGSPTAFRWWYQKSRGPLEEELARPGLGNRIGGFLRMLARRDVFLFAFMLFALARLPQVPVVWYATIGLGHAVLTIVHLLAGGPQRAALAEASR